MTEKYRFGDQQKCPKIAHTIFKKGLFRQQNWLIFFVKSHTLPESKSKSWEIFGPKNIVKGRGEGYYGENEKERTSCVHPWHY